MIRGLHGLLYSSDHEGARAFLRDKLRLPFSDVGDGWLIFDLPEGDLGVHPVEASGRPPTGTHQLSFYCDDIHGTVADLRSRGVVLDHEVEDHGYGLVTHVTIPGGVRIQIYEPRYTKSSRAVTRKPAKKKPTKKKAAGPKRASSTKKSITTKKPAKTTTKRRKPKEATARPAR